jgi:hypothetical protein
VADVGQNTQELKTAYSLVLDNRPREAAMIYLELAEQGVAVAQLNAAILFDKYNIVPDTNRLLLSQVIKHESLNDSNSFNINKHLAFKYFTMAAMQKETEDEANLKLGDFYYYG